MGAYIPAGMGFHCEECRKYFHPGDTGYKEIFEWWKELNIELQKNKTLSSKR